MRIRSGSYGPWTVREEEFPRSGSIDEQLTFLLRYAILAPSAHNTQPWAFRVERNHIRVLADDSRALTVSDPTRRELIVSLGACVANLLVAAEHFGFRASIEEFPKADPQAAVELALVADLSVRTPDGDRLFAAIVKRRANRTLYEQRSISPEILMKLRSVGSSGPAQLTLIDSGETIRALAELTARGVVMGLGTAPSRQELSHWVRTNFTKRPDGIPGFSVGIPDVPSLLGPFLVTLSPIARAEAKKRRAQVESSPVVCVISTPENDRRDWLHAGMALERVWLAATAEGLRVGILAAAIEAGDLCRELQRTLGTERRPQAFFRVGYGPDDPHPTPRRPLADTLQAAA